MFYKNDMRDVKNTADTSAEGLVREKFSKFSMHWWPYVGWQPLDCQPSVPTASGKDGPSFSGRSSFMVVDISYRAGNRYLQSVIYCLQRHLYCLRIITRVVSILSTKCGFASGVYLQWLDMASSMHWSLLDWSFYHKRSNQYFYIISKCIFQLQLWNLPKNRNRE